MIEVNKVAYLSYLGTLPRKRPWVRYGCKLIFKPLKCVTLPTKSQRGMMARQFQGELHSIIAYPVTCAISCPPKTLCWPFFELPRRTSHIHTQHRKLRLLIQFHTISSGIHPSGVVVTPPSDSQPYISLAEAAAGQQLT